MPPSEPLNTSPSYDAVEHLRVDGGELIRLLSDADPSRVVPGCPGWSVDDLAVHVASTWHFWAEVVSLGISDRNGIREVRELGHSADRAAMLETMYDAHVRACDAIHQAGPDAVVWTWTGSNQPVSWVARRMVQETMVHLWDAGQSQDLDLEFVPEVAADGIDEWLTWFAAVERRDGEMKVGGTVHLHCTDDELADGIGEWFVSSMKEPAATFTREHRKGDAAIRGDAQDILMWLWRRLDTTDERLDVVGDPIVARRFQAFTALN